MASPPERIVVVAPSWVGDAMMSLPLLASVRRAWPSAHIAVAARRAVAPLYAMVPGVDSILTLQGRGGAAALQSMATDVRILADGRFDAALLLPNSFWSALIAWRAGIAERWGYRTDGRGMLLTHAIPLPPRRVAHQAAYYLALGTAIGIEPAAMEARIDVPEASVGHARALLVESGLQPGEKFVALAPGAAYGGAKQWPAERFAELARRLADRDGMRTVLVGAHADAQACQQIARQVPAAIDLAGRTDLPTLGGVLSEASAVIANDSGAMHVAAAVGTRLVAIFGPTSEHKSAPLASGRGAAPPIIVATDVWCRPCMLRECPIDHRCMTRISASDVHAQLADL